MQPIADTRLAEALLAGRPAAFDQFLKVYQSRIYRYSLLVCRHQDDAADVAQETLLSVFLHFEELRQPERLRSWVFRIARNFCFLKRRKRADAPREEVSLDEIAPERLADSGAGPDRGVLAAEQQRMMHAAIASLPDSYRAVLLLRDLEGMTTAEAAEVLGLTEEAVRTRLRRARLAIRRRLAGQESRS